MTPTHPHCPACRDRMVRGYMLDLTRNSSTDSKWVEGEPERSFWKGPMLKGRKVLPIVAYRCARCGFLAHYAPDA